MSCFHLLYIGFQCRIHAGKVLISLLQGMVCDNKDPNRTSVRIRSPLLLVCFVPGSACFTGAICNQVKVPNLFNSMVIHADLSKQVLSIRAILGSHLITPFALPVKLSQVATFNILKEDYSRCLGKDLQAPKESILHALAMFDVEASFGHPLLFKLRLQPVRKEHSVCISLHQPTLRVEAVS